MSNAVQQLLFAFCGCIEVSTSRQVPGATVFSYVRLQPSCSAVHDIDMSV